MAVVAGGGVCPGRTRSLLAEATGRPPPRDGPAELKPARPPPPSVGIAPGAPIALGPFPSSPGKLSGGAPPWPAAAFMACWAASAAEPGVPAAGFPVRLLAGSAKPLSPLRPDNG